MVSHLTPKSRPSSQSKQATSTILMGQVDPAFPGVRSVRPDTSRAVTPMTRRTTASELDREAPSPSSSGPGSGSPYRPSKGKGHTPSSVERNAGFVVKIGAWVPWSSGSCSFRLKI